MYEYNSYKRLLEEHSSAKAKLVVGIVFTAIAFSLSWLWLMLIMEDDDYAGIIVFALPAWGIGIPFLITGIVNTVKANRNLALAKKGMPDNYGAPVVPVQPPVYAQPVVPVQPPVYAQPVAPVQPIAVPVTPAEPVQPVAVPVTPVESVQPVAVPVNPAEPVQPVAVPVNPAEPVQPVVYAEATQPLQHAGDIVDSEIPVSDTTATAELDWKKYNPLDAGVSYRADKDYKFHRADGFVGSVPQKFVDRTFPRCPMCCSNEPNWTISQHNQMSWKGNLYMFKCSHCGSIVSMSMPDVTTLGNGGSGVAANPTVGLTNLMVKASSGKEAGAVYAVVECVGNSGVSRECEGKEFKLEDLQDMFLRS